jgi:TonB family protein
MMRRLLMLWALLIGLAAASPTLAQDAAEDWDLAVDPAQALTLASLDFGDNVLALRCKAGALDFLLTGTPVSTEAVRTVRVTAGGIADERQAWQTQPGLPVLSASEPDRLARQLRAGGDLDIRIEPVATGERALRFRLTLPASAASVDRVLSACGASLADEWDLRPRAGGTVTWAHQVLPEYPEAGAMRNVGLASVRLACIVPASGPLEECRILYEAPDGLGFGRNALAAARRSSVALPPDDLSDLGKVVQFTMHFRMPED